MLPPIKNILVVGHTGLVGQEFIKSHLNDKYRIYGVNSQISGKDNKNLEKVTHILLSEIEKYDFSQIILPVQNLAFKNNVNATLNSKLLYETEKTLKNYLVANSHCKLIVLSSVAVYGDYEFLSNVNQIPNNPSLYGIYKSNQEEIFNLSALTDQVRILRLPAVLCKNSVNHFPARLLSNLKLNQDILVTNPNRLWNSCLMINDLIELIHKVIADGSGTPKIIVPHAQHAVKIVDVVKQMKQELHSLSQIKILSNHKNGGISYINFDSGYDTINVVRAISLYTSMNI